MNSDRIELDGKKRKLAFNGSCMDILPLCSAACCREWVVGITFEEYTSGLYSAEQMCVLTDKECDKKIATCINRTFQLRRNDGKACFHLDENNRCSIYERRPKVCRDFSCEGGWRLDSVFPIMEKGKAPGAEIYKETFVKQLTDDMTFVSHPLIKLHAIFYAKAKSEITFLKEMVGTCGKFYSRDYYQDPQLNDDLLLCLIRLFDSKDTLQKIRQRFCEQQQVGLAQNEFYEIVWLLNKHNIILNAKNFRGMLAGMGGI
jgi:Fe-S-cluster containining protein